MEIIEGIHWIKGVNGNCFLVVGSELTLIDTGLPRNTKKISDYISRELHREPSELKTIILTHYHIDHVGCARELKDRTGARVAAHPEDAGFIDGTKPTPGPKGGVRILFKLLSPFMRAKKVKIDLLLNEGDIVAGLKIVRVPGHTPGSIALLDPARKVLFTGDALTFRDGRVTAPPGRFTMDPELARRSIMKIKTLDFDTMLGGHGEPLTPNASARVREFDVTRPQQ
jgi:glyoxylase-like metal-dependent hydrolase (beta-lactamase superfamily II)